ncbi:polynucleotide kinase-phosphatase [Risungbinella massiliensis]|uniref:polynucleotide kinase-phosphatase n=1 Tax=Risungbinella massiliensis TaxID=1329796 RepID=UPI0005CC2649|nr:polynucleotide kinase-phosphatase [Risungbinella massiliensis]
MRWKIPNLALVVLIGPSGSGKSTFAKRHFRPTEILSSDTFRGLVSDDEMNQSVSKEAFAALHFILEKRLQIGRLTVVDATNLRADARAELRQLAKQYHVPVVAIVLDLPESICQAWNKQRGEKALPTRVIRRHSQILKQEMSKIRKEFRGLLRIRNVEEWEATEIVRVPLHVDRRYEEGPFDIIGDVHGCVDELLELIDQLGYSLEQHKDGYQLTHPDVRKLIFVGDLVDRGPDSPAVLRLVRDLVMNGQALCVVGNHDDKLLRKLKGGKVKVQHGLETTMKQLAGASQQELEQHQEFLENLPHHLMLDQGKLVVAHAGLKQEFHGRSSGAVRSFALYGETTGQLDEEGYPVRLDWALDYAGEAFVVYGHTPQAEPYWLGNTVNIDTGCVFGGRLTALRYPEKTMVSVSAKQEYAKYRRSLQAEHSNELKIGDLKDKPILTRYLPPIRLKENQIAPALEIMSQHTVHPNWLIYLPPTMSPTETSDLPDYLEHPKEAFRYYQELGVQEVICEEKHMGSRALLVVCRTPEVAIRRFRMKEQSYGVIYTRTGRPFFSDRKREQEILQRTSEAISKSGLWEELQTDWVLLDAEILPWSEKAMELLRTQYAAVGAAANASMTRSVEVLQKAKGNGLPVDELLNKYQSRQHASQQFVASYQPYCWEVESVEDIRIAPFHLLASERKVHHDREHLWHLHKIESFCKHESLLQVTNYIQVDLQNQESIQEAIVTWKKWTSSDGEGMVVKPKQFLWKQDAGIVQPAIKVRGKEYLRIIYGPEYTLPENLERLRKRNVRRKRWLALQEFCLGLEGLERFVNQEPLRRVHECAFAVLAFETDPIDPRL